jgi:hypothetical protein
MPLCKQVTTGKNSEEASKLKRKKSAHRPPEKQLNYCFTNLLPLVPVRSFILIIQAGYVPLMSFFYIDRGLCLILRYFFGHQSSLQIKHYSNKNFIGRLNARAGKGLAATD